MKKTFIYLTLSIASGAVLILVLYIGSSTVGKNTKNGFIRIAKDQSSSLINTIDLKYNSFYIAGSSQQNIYLANYTAPLFLFTVRENLQGTTRMMLDNKNLYLDWSYIKTTIDSPDVYLIEGITPNILHSTLSSKSIERIDTNKIHFSSSIPLSKKSLIIKIFDPKTQQHQLAKKTNDQYYIPKKEVLQKQVDGRFSVDGMLSYDKKSNRIIYTYFYRNTFICLDTMLNIIYKGKTIDTTSQAKISVGEIKSENKITMTSPPMLVNKLCTISDGKIFIVSNLKGDNEDTKNFNENSTIDVYSLKDGQYLGSLHLPHYKNHGISSITVHNNHIITIQDRYLCSYKIDIKNI